MNLEDITVNEIYQSQKSKHCYFHLDEGSKIVRNPENRMQKGAFQDLEEREI